MKPTKLDRALQRLEELPSKFAPAVLIQSQIDLGAGSLILWDKPPTKSELDQASLAIAGWLAARSFPPTARQLDIAPLLFGSTTFLEDSRFQRALEAHLKTETRPNALVRVIQGLADRDERSGALAAAWIKANLPRHQELAHVDGSQFDENGLLERLRERISRSTFDLRQALSAVSPALADVRSGLARRICSRLPSELARSVVSDGLDPAVFETLLEQLFVVGLSDAGGLAALASSLIEAAQSQHGAERARAVSLVDTLLRHSSDIWRIIDPKWRALFISLSPRRVLELAFEVMRPVDDLVSWKSLFWLGLIDQGVIEDATLVLGGPALERLEGLSVPPERREAVASIDTIYDTCVLLMRGQVATFAEWSPSGKCRVWLYGNPETPLLAQTRYGVRAFRNGADYEQSHNGSGQGIWQRELLSYMTGIGMQVPNPDALLESGPTR